jgi:hypothetical protein
VRHLHRVPPLRRRLNNGDRVVELVRWPTVGFEPCLDAFSVGVELSSALRGVVVLARTSRRSDCERSCSLLPTGVAACTRNDGDVCLVCTARRRESTRSAMARFLSPHRRLEVMWASAGRGEGPARQRTLSARSAVPTVWTVRRRLESRRSSGRSSHSVMRVHKIRAMRRGDSHIERVTDVTDEQRCAAHGRSAWRCRLL